MIFSLKAKPCAAFLPCIFEVCLMIDFKVSFIRNPFIILAIICEVRFEFTNATSGVCFLLPRANGDLLAICEINLTSGKSALGNAFLPRANGEQISSFGEVNLCSFSKKC